MPFELSVTAAEAKLAELKVALITAEAAQRGLEDQLKNAAAKKAARGAVADVAGDELHRGRRPVDHCVLPAKRAALRRAGHPPLIIWVMLGALTFACAVFAGYDMAGRKHLNLLHSAAFAAVLAVTAYVIVDLEYPRIGLIQMSDSDRVLVDLRGSMN